MVQGGAGMYRIDVIKASNVTDEFFVKAFHYALNCIDFRLCDTCLQHSVKGHTITIQSRDPDVTLTAKQEAALNCIIENCFSAARGIFSPAFAELYWSKVSTNDHQRFALVG